VDAGGADLHDLSGRHATDVGRERADGLLDESALPGDPQAAGPAQEPRDGGRADPRDLADDDPVRPLGIRVEACQVEAGPRAGASTAGLGRHRGHAGATGR
jgi:hypothetical protein